MILLCIDDRHLGEKTKTRLTKGKTYDATEYYIGYAVTNDDGEKETFCKERFVRLDIKRDIKLKKLGI